MPGKTIGVIIIENGAAKCPMRFEKKIIINPINTKKNSFVAANSFI